ncbi:MAG: alpha/beta hydrolase [Ignavibacterium sp.]|nr:MAG: alpha/beta hydrolase [Ignavibacterium sp.]
MSKVILGIHGLGNKPSKKILEDWWRNSILEGLEGINKNKFNLNFELIYWADVLNDKPLDETIIDKEDPYYVREKYISAPENFIPTPHSFRKKVLGFLEKQMDKIFLNEDLSINYSFISDIIIHKYFKELEIYYTEECYDQNKAKCAAKDIIRNKVVYILNKYKDEEIMIIAHSMGSIIAYDVLTFILPEIEIDSLVTMGSPLGLPIIMSKIASEQNIRLQRKKRLETPPGVKRNWFNFSDLGDKVAINFDLGDDYNDNANGVKPIDFIVHNNYEINGERNPHKSYGYLRTPELSKIIHEFLIRGETKLSMSLSDYTKNIYQRFNKLIRNTKSKLRYINKNN